MYTIKFSSFLIFVITLITPLLSDCMSSTKDDLYLQPDIENALLEANWQKVYDYLENDSSLAEKPVARLLMAHACLATNRNNASMILFLSSKEEGDLKLWSEWTESLAMRNPQNAVALYLYADAMARSGKLAEAIERFTQAFEQKDDFALALNARGVAYAMTNKLDNAQVDFYVATKLAPEFADAYANLGTLGVFRETSMALDSGTVEAFDKALVINPEFAFAYNGRGCIYFGSGRFEEAAQDFSIASELSPLLLIAEVNQGFASAYASRLLTLASIEKKPGTTLESVNRLYPNVMKEQQQQWSNVLPTPKDQKFWTKIDALPTLSPDQVNSLVKDYGRQKVQMASFLKMQKCQAQIAENHQIGLPLSEKIDLSNRFSFRAFSFLESTKEVQAGWKSLFSPQTNRIDTEKMITGLFPKEPSGPRFLIDIPGVGWTGGARENDWGNMLSPNKVTVYIRHEGPGIDKWDQPKEANAIVVTLPNQWNEKTANDLLLPQLNSAFSQEKDLHFIVDKNITLSRHILPDPLKLSRGEDRWAANVTDYISKQRTSNYSGILTEHSRGTVTNLYVKDFSAFERIIVSSPRGDDALSWIQKTPNLPRTDIITGISDAPNLRWTERYGTILKENPNVRIIQFQAIADPITTHSRLQNFGTEGNWKIITGTGYHDFKGRLGDLLMEKKATKSFTHDRLHSIVLLGVQYRALENKFSRLNEVHTSTPKIQSSSPIQGFYTSVNRPLTEIGSLAAKLNQTIKSPANGLPRQVLLVTDKSSFRAKLQQLELQRYGFVITTVSPHVDVRSIATQCGANAIVGIKDTEMKVSKSLTTRVESLQPNLPQSKQNWDWGTSFTPTYPKTAPGGVSTDELARSFVDKGNWPVMTSFGLFYQAISSMESQKAEEGK